MSEPYIRRVMNPAATYDTLYTWKRSLFNWGERIGLADAKAQKSYRAAADLHKQFERVDGRVIPIEWGALEDQAYAEFIRGYDAGFNTHVRRVASYHTSSKKTAEEFARTMRNQGFEEVEIIKGKQSVPGLSNPSVMYQVTALTTKRGSLPYGISEV
jgi:hypothetical protein